MCGTDRVEQFRVLRLTTKQQSHGIRIDLPNILQQIGSAQSGHIQIGDNNIKGVLSKTLDRFGTTTAKGHCPIATVRAKEFLEGSQFVWVVVNEENLVHLGTDRISGSVIMALSPSLPPGIRARD